MDNFNYQDLSSMSGICVAIHKTLHYFAFFEHPLSVDEVWYFLPVAASKDEVKAALKAMEKEHLVATQNGFYALLHQKEVLEKRKSQYELNIRLKRLGMNIGRFLLLFPFVQAVFISGSVSKNGAKENDDIDFFIIASSGRVWIAKFLIVAFKKIFLLNSNKYFCINFIIGTDQLEIQNKNIYTATETVSVLPVLYNDTVTAFTKINCNWVQHFFPNHPFVIQSTTNIGTQQKRKKPVGLLNYLDALCMKIFHINTTKKYKFRPKATILADKSTAAVFPNSPEAALLAHYHKAFPNG